MWQEPGIAARTDKFVAMDRRKSFEALVGVGGTASRTEILETYKVEALDAGANNYLVKPFGVPQLLARVRARLRHVSLAGTAGPATSIMRFGQISVDLATREVTRAGSAVHLTPTEFRLLASLLRGHGRCALGDVGLASALPSKAAVTRTSTALQLSAMCGRLLVGKGFLHGCSWSVAAMCSACLRGSHDRWL
jgi:hypothetical protein